MRTVLRTASNRRTLRGLLAALPLWVLLIGVAAASAEDLLAGISEEDRGALEVFALYPEESRRLALEAATETDVLADLSRRQERSRAAFQQLLAPYDRDIQESFYELTRYPELISALVGAGPIAAEAVEEIAADYPNEVQAHARSVGVEHWRVLARVDALLRDEANAFEARIAGLPDSKQEAFLALIDTPELLSLLADNTTLTVLLGDAYERRPEDVIAWLGALHEDVTERGFSEAQTFAEGVDGDPVLRSEVDASAIRYQEETGYSAYQPVTIQRSVVRVNVRPCAWWVGYPGWYATHYAHYDPWYYWYPRAHWAVGGFHFGPRISVSFGFPHWGFWGWFFHGPSRYHHYPRLTRHVVHHHRYHDRYRAPRGHGSHHRYARDHARRGGHAVERFVRDNPRERDRSPRTPSLKQTQSRAERLGTRRPGRGSLARPAGNSRPRVDNRHGRGPGERNLAGATSPSRPRADNRHGRRPGEASVARATPASRPRADNRHGRRPGQTAVARATPPARTRAETRHGRRTDPKAAPALKRPARKQARGSERPAPTQAQQRTQMQPRPARKERPAIASPTRRDTKRPTVAKTTRRHSPQSAVSSRGKGGSKHGASAKPTRRGAEKRSKRMERKAAKRSGHSARRSGGSGPSRSTRGHGRGRAG